MSKVTSKLQVTIPKAIADRFGIAPGDDIDWIVTGESIVETAATVLLVVAGTTAAGAAWGGRKSHPGLSDFGQRTAYSL